MLAKIKRVITKYIPVGLAASSVLMMAGCGAGAPGSADGAENGDVAAATEAVLGSTLPSGWSKKQIGSTSVSSKVQFDPTYNSFEIDGAGSLQGGSYEFTYKNVTGDFEITAELTGIDGTAASRYGIAVKSQLNANSSTVALVMDPNLVLHLDEKVGTSPMVEATVSSNYWVKIARHGNVISTYVTDPDQFNWQLQSQAIVSDLGSAAYFGLIVASGATNATAHAYIDRIDVQKLNPYSSTNIGSVGVTGSTTYDADSDTLAVQGGGVGMVGKADSLRFASRKVTGNFEFDTYVDPPTGARGGVMVRTSTSSNAAGMFLAFDNSDNLFLTTRGTAGANAVDSQYTGSAYSSWLQISRSGDTLLAYTNPDGGYSWNLVGSMTLPPNTPTVYLGYADASGVSGSLGYVQASNSSFWSSTMQ